MASSWDSPGPKRKLVDTHSHVGYLYGFLAVVFALLLSMGLGRADFDFKNYGIVALFAALAFCHFKVSAAAEKDKHWVAGASFGLALLLLPAFPIGTFFGCKILINALNLKQP